MIPLYGAALEIQSFFTSRKWPFCIIGGVAAGRWGEIRATKDVDLTLGVQFGDEEEHIKPILQQFEARIPNALEFAIQNRIILARASNRIPFDVSLGGFPFDEEMIRRASYGTYEPGVVLNTCSAEDLIVLKAFADRETDWVDIKGVVVRQGPKLDWDYVHRQLRPLVELKASPEILTRLDTLRRGSER